MQIVVSGDTTQVVVFQAPTNIASQIKVRYKRGSGSWTSMTTPSVSEGDQANCPGAYALLLNQGTTMSVGKQTELLALRFYTDDPLAMTPFIEKVCLVKNLPSDLNAVLGEQLVAGGASPVNPFGVAG